MRGAGVVVVGVEGAGVPFSGWKRERKIALIIVILADYLPNSAATNQDYIALL